MSRDPTESTSEMYAQNVCAKLPVYMQRLRMGAKMTMYALWKACGISRDTISRIEAGETVPGLHVLAQLVHALDTNMKDFFEGLEQGPPVITPGRTRLTSHTPQATSLPDWPSTDHDPSH